MEAAKEEHEWLQKTKKKASYREYFHIICSSFKQITT